MLNDLRYVSTHPIWLSVITKFLHRYFHVCEGGLLPDVMHDVLEGYEVKIMLQAMVEDEHCLTLNELNSRLGRVRLHGGKGPSKSIR